MNNDTEQKINGVDHRLLDGYDGGTTPPKDFIAQLLEGAPPAVQARAKEYAAQREANANKDKKTTD